ncbi:MAG: cysteine desulfurase [Bacteroidales bacterium]|nr:cysteine desulfurase [Bacteroidales bacterium]MBN2756092.1 cysteine desulfurase [Bacteroidales bacterium]
MNFDIEKIRADFPILNQKIYGKDYIYFDNGATTQKPIQVINAVSEFYSSINSNIHRGVHLLSEKSTKAYEDVRAKVQKFINAEHEHEIIFTKGTTDSINLIAFSFGEKYVNKGDEIIVSAMEHHSNLVPWQMLCQRKNAKLKIIHFDKNGELETDKINDLITDRTKLLAVTHISNALGTINPVKKIVQLAHNKNVPVLIDGAQAIQHTIVDVQEIDCDFYVFSGHKIYAETGIGVLYGKEKFLNEIPPYQGGGDMVDHVTLEKSTYLDLPFKFEAGTSNYVGAVSLGIAIDYINEIGLNKIAEYETELLNYATQKMQAIEGLTIFGNAKNKASVISFLLKNIHHYDAGMIIDKMGIAVRTGSHCAQPVMTYFDITGTIRASFAFYNTKEEIDRFIEAILKVKQMFD